MNKTIKPVKRLSGTLRVPPDKSITHRAVLISSLSKGKSAIKNPLEGEDCLSTLRCVQSLGCGVNKRPGEWIITSKGLWGYKKPKAALDCGNSGTTMRLLSGILSAQGFTSVLQGDDSLSKRPMDRVAEPLRQMGASVDLTDGRYPPLTIKGTKKVKPLQWVNPVSSAQVKSSVLLAGLHARGETSFAEPTLSRDHTERMLEACGVPLKRAGTKITLSGPASLKAQTWVVPGDFSSAAFFIAAALMTDSDLTLEAVNLNPTRTGFLDVLQMMGASFAVQRKEAAGEPIGTLRIRGKADLRGVDVDPFLLARCIDEVPVLAVVAARAKGTTRLKGLSELRIKETDRVAAVAKNLSAMGARVQEGKDSLTIEGPASLKGASLSSFRDHRIAMAFAAAALAAEGETEIREADSVSVSYPSFWDDVESISSS